jgi:hypothetical protein
VAPKSSQSRSNLFWVVGFVIEIEAAVVDVASPIEAVVADHCAKLKLDEVLGPKVAMNSDFLMEAFLAILDEVVVVRTSLYYTIIVQVHQFL